MNLLEYLSYFIEIVMPKWVSWEQRKFEDLADYKKGPFGSAITKDMFVPKGKDSVKVYEQQNAINKDWLLERYFLPKEYVLTKLKSFEVYGGDIIVSCAGTIGEIYEIPENADTGIINQALMRVRVNEDIVNKSMFIIAFSNMIDEFTRTHSNGSAIKNIPPFADLKPMQILIPSMPEQKKISAYFCHLDHLITLHQCKSIINDTIVILTWEQRKLGELADIVGGGTPSTSRDEYWDGDIDWYAPAEIADQIYVNSSERKITEEGFNNSSAKMLPVGTVLFTSRAGIGKMAILHKKSCTNQGFQSIVPHENELDSYFIFSRSEELKRYGETVGAGSTFIEVSGKQMAAMDLMMPFSIKEQRKIGRYFEYLDALITLHQRKSVKNDTIIIFAWEQRKLGELAEYRRGSFPQPYGNKDWYDGEGAMPFVQVADVTDEMNLVADTKQKISKLAQPMSVYADKNSVLVTLQGSIGRVAITQYGAFVDRTVLIFEKYKKEIDYIFFAYIIKQKFIEKARKAPGGTIKTITKEALSDFALMLPDYKEQMKIGQYLQSLDHLITLHQRKQKCVKTH